MESGARWSIAGQTTIAACQLLQLVVLARLLTSFDFGIGAILMVLIAAGQIFWDFGTSAAVIQRPEISQGQLSALHVLNIALGLLFGILLWTFAPILADAFAGSEATSLLRWTAAVPLIAAVGGQFRALHLRQMNFRKLALIDMAAALASCSAAIAAARAGSGAYAFVFAGVTSATVNTALLISSGLRIRAQSPTRGPTGIAHFLRFGTYQTGSSLINFAYLNLDVLILGALLSTAELGKYSFAKQLCVRPLEILQPVLIRSILPQLARLQEDISALRAHFLDVFRILNALYLPIFAALIATAGDLVHVIFGAKWRDAAALFQILATAHAIRFLMVPSSISLMATGRVSRGFYWDLAMIGLLATTVIAYQPQSATAMAWILLGTFAIALLPHWYLVVRTNLQLALGQWISAFLRPLGISAMAAGLISVIASSMNQPAVHLLIAATAGLAVYSLLTLWLNRSAIQAAGVLWRVRS